MFKFTDAKTAACAGGEPILLEFQDCDWSGTARSLAGRSFVVTIYDMTGALATQVSQTITDSTGDVARFVLAGTVSDGLRSKTGLYLDLAERLHPGDDQMLSATLTINRAAPLTADLGTAPVARYIQRVRRLFDPVAHAADPTYTFATEVFVSQAGGLNADFSQASNALFFSVF